MFTENERLNLPEVSELLGLRNPAFDVMGVIHGGMGQVVHLRSCESGGEYALKRVIPAQDMNAQSRLRFLREAEVWREASTCDGVVEAYAIIQIDGALCVIAEWMAGGALRSQLARLGWSDRIACALRMTKTLRWVHENLGFAHRDLKPENVLLDAEGRAYISDWGLAKLSSTRAPPRTGALQTRGGMGTPAYMAPEQFVDAKSVDHRADIYSLGCMLFEFEHGLPPALARPASPKGSSTSSPMYLESGLHDIVTRCLQQEVSSRCADYAEIEEALVSASRMFAVPEELVYVGMRALRAPLTSAHKRLASLTGRSTARSSSHALIKLSDIQPHLEEVQALMGLGRYDEARRLLEPMHIPRLLDTLDSWCPAHSIAAAYADCLQRDAERIQEAIDLFARLEKATGKPAGYFVNASLANLRASRWNEALRIARAGLRHFPDDIALLGNCTGALVGLGLLDDALVTAKKRLALRRDTRALEELTSVLGSQRDRVRPSDLPRAVALATKQNELICEGLSLSSSDATLRSARAELFRFAHAPGTACEAYDEIVKDEPVHTHLRQLALARQASIFADTLEYPASLDAVDRIVAMLQHEGSRQVALTAKWRLLAEQEMFARVGTHEHPIVVREVTEFFLQRHDDRYQQPVMAARILRLMCEEDKAEEALRSAIADGTDRQAAHSELVVLLVGLGRMGEALEVAQRLVRESPWQAASFDTLSFAAQRSGDSQLAASAKTRADHCFAEEQKLFARLRANLGVTG